MFSKPLGLPSQSYLGRMIWSMAAAPNGDLWFGASHALWRLTPAGVWHSMTRRDGLPGDDVLALAIGRDGTLWAALWEMQPHGYVGCGVSRLNADQTWTTLTTADGLPSNNVRTLEVAADGSLWVGTGDEDRRRGEGAARRSSTGTWERYTITQGLSANYVEQICAAPDGSIWIITLDLARRVLRLFPDGRRFIYTERDGLIDAWVNAVAVAGDGTVWFGTAQGASRLGPDERWTNYGVAEGLLHSTVVAVAPAPDGAVWFGTPLGLCRLDAEGHWSSYSTGVQRPDHHIHTLCTALDGSAWAATVSGLFHFDPLSAAGPCDGRSLWTGADGLPDLSNGGEPVGELAVEIRDPTPQEAPRHRKLGPPDGLAAYLAYCCRSINHRRLWHGRGMAAWPKG